jgi:hypothetical protein
MEILIPPGPSLAVWIISRDRSPPPAWCQEDYLSGVWLLRDQAEVRANVWHAMATQIYLEIW